MPEPEPNYQCEILEEKPKTPKIKMWNKYYYNYIYGLILTIILMYLYSKTKDAYFYDSNSNIKYVISVGLLCILALGVAGVWIKNQQIKVVKGKNVKVVKVVNSDKKKMLADVILYSYMIFIGLFGLAYQKFGKTPIKPI